MNHNWTYKKLGEVCEINYGTRVVQKKDKGSTYYVYGGGGATFMVDTYNREDCFIVSRFAMSTKCTRFVKGKFFLNDSGLSVSTKIKELSQPFLDKALLANNDTIYSMGKGMAQRNLDIPSFRNLVVPLPPLETQSRIVSELDLLQSIIDKQKAQLTELDNLAQAVFYDMFGDPVENDKGWEVKKLGEVCSLSQGLAINAKSKHLLVPTGDLPLLRIKDMKEGTREIFVDTKNCPKNCIANPNDIIYTRTGTLGLVFTNMYGVIHNNCFKIKIDNSVLSKVFFMSFIGGTFFLNRITDLAKRSSQPDITHKLFLSQKIVIPSLSLQQTFAAKIEAIEKQKAAINQSIAETQKLFNFTMDKYFG